MRSFIPKIAVLVILSQTCFAGDDKTKESVPAYYISASKADASLQKTEAVFTFRFSENITGKLVNGDVKMSYNGKNVEIKKDENGKGENKIFSLKVKPGKYVFKFFYNQDFYEITTDSVEIRPAHRSSMEVTFTSSKFPVICDKPVIYVYSEKSTQVNIQLDLQGKLNFTYPEYKNGWNFFAEPDGTISVTEKRFNYLFWEGSTEIDMKKINPNEGFIVEKSNLIKFFEEKLSAMGLNSKEQADFITYWCPLMSANEKNYVHFLFNEEFNQYAKLTIDPKPQTVFRVFMLWEKANEKRSLNLTEQKIPSFERKGLTVIEWGGSQCELILR